MREPQLRPKCQRSSGAPALDSADHSHASRPQGAPTKGQMPALAWRTRTRFGTPFTRFVAS
eukprot:2849988-Pyramimonas_sp.AAC.1